VTGGRGLGPGSLRRDERGRYILDYRDAGRRQRRVVLSEDKRTAERMRAEIITQRDLTAKRLDTQEEMDRKHRELRDAFLAADEEPLRNRSRRSSIMILATVLGGVVGLHLGLLTIGFSGHPDPDKWWHLGWLPGRLVTSLVALGAMIGALIGAWVSGPKVK
jgi:hypothetical protein